MKPVKLTTVLLGMMTLAVSLPSMASERFDIGQREFDASCASCHGQDGKGKGPVTDLFKLNVPDLTMLSGKNGGVFPINRVYQVIDGREMVKAHGSREMPIWGKQLSVKAAPDHDDYGHDSEVFVRARILAVIDYLYRLQQK